VAARRGARVLAVELPLEGVDLGEKPGGDDLGAEDGSLRSSSNFSIILPDKADNLSESS